MTRTNSNRLFTRHPDLPSLPTPDQPKSNQSPTGRSGNIRRCLGRQSGDASMTVIKWDL